MEGGERREEKIVETSEDRTEMRGSRTEEKISGVEMLRESQRGKERRPTPENLI